MSRPPHPPRSLLRVGRAKRLLGVFAGNGLPRVRLLVLGLAFAVMIGVTMILPWGRDLGAQLLYVPILLATWSLGAVGGFIAAATAAVGEPLLWSKPVHLAAQPFMYLLFAGVCAWVARRVDEKPAVGHHDESTVGLRGSLEGRDRVLESLARTVEVRDHHTQGHCRRVARNALALGTSLGLGANELEVLYWAALLHDLGKIAVPDYILLKNGRLSEEEFAEIRRHPAYGADLLTSVSASFREIADVVRAHHERWDGLGYPLGFRGVEIPRLARIIAVVDVYEALTSQRPYRSPMPPEQAVTYIAHGSGSQFDPSIVLAFERLAHEGLIECAFGETASTNAELSQQYRPRLRATS